MLNTARCRIESQRSSRSIARKSPSRRGSGILRTRGRRRLAPHFADRQREQPTLWNGRVLLARDFAVADGVLRGSSFETDYASFLAWRDWGCPDASVFNIFAAAALQAADGSYLIGCMAPSTSIAGT